MRTVELGNTTGFSLRNRIKSYRQAAVEMRSHLAERPFEWGKFQGVFNFEINGVFREIMNFERENLQRGKEEAVYKFKRLFVKHIRKEFLHGEYIVWSLEKPFGYAGDYKIIDEIYLNLPKTSGFERLYDNYFQMSAISVAVRNRKEDFKKLISNVAVKGKENRIRVLSLGSGPCRELSELKAAGLLQQGKVIVDCYDNDVGAHLHGSNLLGSPDNVNFVRENVVRLALKKDLERQLPQRYDLIYSSGLFDYLDERVSVRLIENISKLLTRDGALAISDVRDKYSNPSVHFMEWVGDWNLIYRDDEVFRRFFLEAGFKEKNLEIGYEQQGIMQYVIARR